MSQSYEDALAELREKWQDLWSVFFREMAKDWAKVTRRLKK